jgi:hypothetical protein
MTTDELEGIIRDELRAEAARMPSGQATKNAVLLATENLTAADPGLRRWLWPTLVAAAVVLVVAGSILVPRAWHSQRSRPAGRPDPAPSYTVTLPSRSYLGCDKIPGSRVVIGTHASFMLSTDDKPRYVYDFYCVGNAGARSGSAVQLFVLVAGKLRYDVTLTYPATDSHVVSITGLVDGFRMRTIDESPGIFGAPGGDLFDTTFATLDGGGESWNGSGVPVAQPCLAKDLTVALNAGSPALLRLTNHTGLPCALEGYPSLVTQPAGTTLDKSLSGPAGGVTHSPAPPVIELKPGTTAAAMIESSPRHPACAGTAALRITLANGVNLGSVPAGIVACGAAVHPFVNSPSGSD